MGQNLALNIADHGFPISVYNRTIEPTEANFSSDVVNMQGAGVKGIFMAGEVGAFVRVAKAMKQQGFTVPFGNWGANAYDPAFVTSDAAAATNGAIRLATAGPAASVRLTGCAGRDSMRRTAGAASDAAPAGSEPAAGGNGSSGLSFGYWNCHTGSRNWQLLNQFCCCVFLASRESGFRWNEIAPPSLPW